ncbi:hypothetical protein DUNSADRAFT_9395 [Dunaliella salina]|uniref:Encoded protein n=1 Tax=Dunaliella salina TaxID=3046 RepID=A0ABQ7GHJ4_DUNSA|nr:hypothetical protein DUNSADRAFT_9395 [Dunaliella salina]|eukprot:KAF5834081.1 hypothetical protein DUNSADRAFT_9395 [Dunaliella salina]
MACTMAYARFAQKKFERVLFERPAQFFLITCGMDDFAGHRRFLFYESFKLYVLPAHPLQRSRLLQTIFRGLGSQRQAVHKSRHLFSLQHLQVGPKEVKRLRGAGTLLGRGGARHHPHVHRWQKQKLQKEQGMKQEAEDQRQAKLSGRPTLQQAAITKASHDRNQPPQQQAATAPATHDSKGPPQQQAGTAAAPAASPSFAEPPPSQKHPACSPRASAAWRAQLWAGLTNSSNPASRVPHAPRPCRSKLSSSSPFQLASPLASHTLSPLASASASRAPAPSTPPRFQQPSTSIFPTTPLSPAAQEVISTAETLLARAKQLNSRFPPAPIHSGGKVGVGGSSGAAPHAPDRSCSLTLSPNPCKTPRQKQQQRHQHKHRHHQHSAQSTLHAARQLTPPVYQTNHLSDPTPVASTTTLARKEAQIATLVLGAVDPLLENATALACMLGEQAAARGAAGAMKASAHRPPAHERPQPATPVAAVKGTICSDEQGTPVYEASQGSSTAHQGIWASKVKGMGPTGSEEQSTPVYEAGRGSSAADRERWASSVQVQRGLEGVEVATPRYSPGRSTAGPLPEQEHPASVRNDMSWSACSHDRSSMIAGVDSSRGRGSKSAGADSVFSWRQRVGWEEGAPPAGLLAGGSARRRLDFEGLPSGMRLGNALAVGVGAPGGSAGVGPGLQVLTITEQGDSTYSRPPCERPSPQDGTSLGPEASATNTPTRSRQSKFVGGQDPEASATNTPTRSLQSKFVGGQGGSWVATPQASHAHPGQTVEAQIWGRTGRTRRIWGLAGASSRPQQSGMRVSRSARASSASPVLREVQQKQQQGGQGGAAKAYNLLGMDSIKARGRRSCKACEARACDVGVGSSSRRISRKSVRNRFMRPTIAAIIKRQAAHPAARPSRKGQQAALMRRAAGLSPSAPVAAGRFRQPASLIRRRLH